MCECVLVCVNACITSLACLSLVLFLVVVCFFLLSEKTVRFDKRFVVVIALGALAEVVCLYTSGTAVVAVTVVAVVCFFFFWLCCSYGIKYFRMELFCKHISIHKRYCHRTFFKASNSSSSNTLANYAKISMTMLKETRFFSK